MLYLRSFQRNGDVRRGQVSKAPITQVVCDPIFSGAIIEQSNTSRVQQTGTNFAPSARELPIDRLSGLFLSQNTAKFSVIASCADANLPLKSNRNAGAFSFQPPVHLKLIDTSEQFCTGRPYSSPADRLPALLLFYRMDAAVRNTATRSRQNYIGVATIALKASNGGLGCTWY